MEDFKESMLCQRLVALFKRNGDPLAKCRKIIAFGGYSLSPCGTSPSSRFPKFPHAGGPDFKKFNLGNKVDDTFYQHAALIVMREQLKELHGSVVPIFFQDPRSMSKSHNTQE